MVAMATCSRDGARVPRLEDVFALVRRSGNDAVRFNIETKISPLAPEQTANAEDFARKLIAVVRTAGMAGRTSIQSFDWRTLRVVQKEAPEMPTVYLSAQQDFMDNIRAALVPAASEFSSAARRYRELLIGA